MKKLLGKIFNNNPPAKAALAFMLCNVFQKSIATLTTPIFTRIMTASEYGTYSVFVSWIEIISVFSTLSLAHTATMHALVKYEKNKYEFASSLAGLGIISTVISLALYILLKDIVNEFTGMNTLCTLSLFVSALYSLFFNLWSKLQRIDYQYKGLVCVTVLTSVLIPIVGIVSVLQNPFARAEARILSSVFIEVLVYSILIIGIFREGRMVYNYDYWKYAIKLCVPLIPHYLTRTFLNQSDKIMIKIMNGSAQAGIYSLAHSIAFLMTMINTSLIESINPWFFKKMHLMDYCSIKKVTNRLIDIIFFCNLFVIIFAPEIMRIFAPQEYYEAIYVIPPLSMSVFWMFQYYLFTNIEFFYEKTTITGLVSITGAIINIVLNYIFIQKFGYIAAGYTTMFCNIYFVLIHYFFISYICKKKGIGINYIYDLKHFILISFVFVSISACIIILYRCYFVYRLLLSVLIMGFVFVKRDYYIETWKKNDK